MLTAFNRTMRGDFWWYRDFAVSLQRDSEDEATRAHHLILTI